jgi:hypothetical protein
MTCTAFYGSQFFAGQLFSGASVSGPFFGGPFFEGGFFGGVEAAPTVTPAGGVVRRRWAKIGKRVYHATDEEIAYLLRTQPIEVVPLTKRQAKRIRAKQAKQIEAPKPVIKPTWDDEDDIEILLWH